MAETQKLLNELTINLHLPKEETIEIPILLSLIDLDLDETDLRTTSIMDVLQDVSYITWWKEIRTGKCENTLSELDKKDECWDIITQIFNQIATLYVNKYNEINNQDNLDVGSFENRNGKQFVNFVNSQGEPYITRYKIFKLLSLLKKLLGKTIQDHYMNTFSCKMVVSNYSYFLQYWNKGIPLFGIIIDQLFKKDIDEWMKKFKEIVTGKAGAGKFKDKFEKKSGCFSITTVMHKEKVIQDVLCFSGNYDGQSLYDKTDIKQVIENKIYQEALERISSSSYFINSYLIKFDGNVKYYTSSGKVIPFDKYYTYLTSTGQVLDDSGRRMFSCCERKTIDCYPDWDKCNSYIMLVRFPPCDFCLDIVQQHNSDKHGVTISPPRISKNPDRHEADERTLTALDWCNKQQKP